MKIVYIAAQLPPNNSFVKNNSKVMPQYAADHVSTLFCTGIQLQEGVKVEIINLLPIASWPMGSKCVNVPKFNWFINQDQVEGVSYCNIEGIRQYSKFMALRKRLKKNMKEWNKEGACVVAYSLSTPILKAFKYIKRKASNIKTCLIVPDLPQYMNMGGSVFYRFLKKMDMGIQRNLFEYIDGLVLFSEHMKEFFPHQADRYIVVEGAVDYKLSCQEISKEKPDTKEKIILYSGALEEAYGIGDLLEAFMQIRGDDYKLQIIGNGNGLKLVYEAAKCDKRIEYLGVMEREKVAEYQKKATLLVNPRTAENKFTKYSFPSKTLEYMMSGTPALMHKLGGIPEEYNEYLIYFENNDLVQMAKQMKEICDKSDEWRNEKGRIAREFVMCKKNNKIQMSRLYSFIKTL